MITKLRKNNKDILRLVEFDMRARRGYDYSPYCICILNTKTGKINELQMRYSWFINYQRKTIYDCINSTEFPPFGYKIIDQVKLIYPECIMNIQEPNIRKDVSLKEYKFFPGIYLATMDILEYHRFGGKDETKVRIIKISEDNVFEYITGYWRKVSASIIVGRGLFKIGEVV